MAARSGKHQSKSKVFSKAESPLLCVYDVLLNIIALPRLSPESEQRTGGAGVRSSRGVQSLLVFSPSPLSEQTQSLLSFVFTPLNNPSLTNHLQHTLITHGQNLHSASVTELC